MRRSLASWYAMDKLIYFCLCLPSVSVGDADDPLFNLNLEILVWKALFEISGKSKNGSDWIRKEAVWPSVWSYEVFGNVLLGSDGLIHPCDNR